MLKHTKKIKEMYEDIQRNILYMIPEKWEKILLYASVVDSEDGNTKGELFFYYIPKGGIFKKNPINVYEIPQKFNLDEKEYLKLVNILYRKIVALREEFRTVDIKQETWSNITMQIKGIEFRAEYGYEDLTKSDFTSYEHHIIWRYKYLNIKEEQLSKEERQILNRYLSEEKKEVRKENYDAGIYIRDIRNIVDYDTENYLSEQSIEYMEPDNKKIKNQIVMSDDKTFKERL